MNATQFQNLIRRTLLEEVEKRSSSDREIYERLPEVVDGEDLKDAMQEKRDSHTKDEILDAITKAVKPIDSSVVVVWDDHDDISINARDMFRVRVIPRWENNYNIEAFIRNEDRIYVTNQRLEQVVEFLKVNLKNAATKTYLAYEKSKANGDMRNDKTPSPDKGLSQKDKPKTLPLTNEKPSEAKNKNKDYTEKQTKEEKDLPEKPMREVGKFEKQVDHKVKDPVKLRKRKPDTKLTVPISKQDTSKL
jgi:hypothetical protein